MEQTIGQPVGQTGIDRALAKFVVRRCQPPPRLFVAAAGVGKGRQRAVKRREDGGFPAFVDQRQRRDRESGRLSPANREDPPVGQHIPHIPLGNAQSLGGLGDREPCLRSSGHAHKSSPNSPPMWRATPNNHYCHIWHFKHR